MDPVVADTRDPQSYNAYAYARNNPVSNADPTGASINDSWFDGVFYNVVVYAGPPSAPTVSPTDLSASSPPGIVGNSGAIGAALGALGAAGSGATATPGVPSTTATQTPRDDEPDKKPDDEKAVQVADVRVKPSPEVKKVPLLKAIRWAMEKAGLADTKAGKVVDAAAKGVDLHTQANGTLTLKTNYNAGQTGSSPPPPGLPLRQPPSGAIGSQTFSLGVEYRF